MSADDVVIGGVPMPEQKDSAPQPAAPEARASRRRKRPDMATARQGLLVLILGLVFVFALGVLSGVLLAYGCWSGEPSDPDVGEKNHLANQIPKDTAQTDPSQETDGETTEPETEPQTEPETEPQTEPQTEPETEPETEPQTEPETEPAAAGNTSSSTSTNAGSYFFSDSNSRYLTYDDYKDLSWWHLILARNEIFARHGRKFANADIQAYFNGCGWYQGTIAPEDFDSSVLNDYEVKNVYILKDAAEARQGGR